VDCSFFLFPCYDVIWCGISAMGARLKVMGPMCQSWCTRGFPEDWDDTVGDIDLVTFKISRHDITARVLGILQHILILKIIKQIML
jgi:hypothetical protein